MGFQPDTSYVWEAETEEEKEKLWKEYEELRCKASNQEKDPTNPKKES